MTKDLLQLFNSLENQREGIVNRVAHLTEDKFKTGKNGKWSIAQILTHILTSERLSIGYMKKKSLGIDQLENSGLIEALRYKMLKASQRIPFLKYNAPKVVAEKTPEALSFQDLDKEWRELRADLRSFLSRIEEKNVRKKIYKHPVAGRLNVKQALGFLGDHIHHHLPQIDRQLIEQEHLHK